MPKNDVETLERGLLEWVAEDVFTRLLCSVPESQRDDLARQAREELGRVLCTAPIVGDPIADIMARAEIAAAFAVPHLKR